MLNCFIINSMYTYKKYINFFKYKPLKKNVLLLKNKLILKNSIVLEKNGVIRSRLILCNNYILGLKLIGDSPQTELKMQIKFIKNILNNSFCIRIDELLCKSNIIKVLVILSALNHHLYINYSFIFKKYFFFKKNSSIKKNRYKIFLKLNKY